MTMNKTEWTEQTSKIGWTDVPPNVNILLTIFKGNVNTWSTESNINLWTTTGAGGTAGYASYAYSNNASAKLGFKAEL